MTNSEWIEKLRAAAAMCQSPDDDLDYKYWAAVAFGMLPKASVRITELEAQVAALQEIAIGERAWFLHYRASCYDPIRRCPYAKECDDCTDWDTCSALDRFNADARRQLSEEHPEAFR